MDENLLEHVAEALWGISHHKSSWRGCRPEHIGDAVARDKVRRQAGVAIAAYEGYKEVQRWGLPNKPSEPGEKS